MMYRRMIAWLLLGPVMALSVLGGASAEQGGAQPGYRIGPNDVIRIQVFGEEDLTVEGRVGGDGKLTYPLLGALRVEGRTTDELQRELTTRLADGYVRQPKVSVSIVRHRNFYVSGEVKTPGGFPFEDGLTVQKAVTMAGGFTEKAARGVLLITRHAGQQEQSIPSQLHTPLLPDDTLVVGQLQKFFLMGEVAHPGSYSYEEQLTANKAISLGGGFTEKADRQEIKVTRVTDAGAQTLHLTLDDLVLPNDILAVSTQNRKFYITGEVRNAGSYLYGDHITLQKALALAGGPTEKADKEQVTVRRVVDGQERTLLLKLDEKVQVDDLIVVGEGQKLYVIGEVKTPGRYAYEPGATVERALSLAGGVTDKAEATIVKVTRMKGKGVETLVLPHDAPVLPSDIIFVVRNTYRFYVNGEVKTPGSYAHKDGLSLQKALAMAGGLTEKGDMDRLKLVRIVEDHEEQLPATLETLILPDDTLVVPERRKFYVTGEVKTPGRYFYEVGISVQKAITMAGGFTEKADKVELKVERLNGQAVTTISADPNSPALPDDLIVVQQARRFYVNGEVKKPGDYGYERGLTLHKAITMAGGFTEKASKQPKVLRMVNGEERALELALDAAVLPDDIIVIAQRFF
ncbi:MAG TPA: SLBB domain-containing protein [Nitrospira sp.]|nr:SLBB domain-containing protein [Nitrospira sp.]